MNEEYIKEYEEMSLYDFADELVEPLSTVKQDLTKTIYIHYAEERDKNYKLQNNWNELKKWCKETIETVECTDLSEDYLMGCEDILKKMQELEKKR